MSCNKCDFHFQNKVANIVFSGGSGVDDLIKLKQVTNGNFIVKHPLTKICDQEVTQIAAEYSCTE